MKPSMIRSAVAALAFCSNTVLGALTTEQIVANLNTLTTKSQDLQEPAESITAVNGPLIVVGQGPFPEIIRGFVDIVNTGSNDAQELQGTEAITNADDADSVYTAFRDFALVHEKLLNTLTGKAALFSDVPFIGQPIAAVLRQDESVIDTIAFSLIDLVNSRATDIQGQNQGLSSSLDTCMKAYDGSSLIN